MRSSELRKRRSPSTSSSDVIPKKPSQNSFSSTSKPSSPVDQPVHAAQDSLFSGSSGFTDYRGFFNLAMMLLIVSNGRVALENLIKYGILISPATWISIFSRDVWKWPNLTMVLLSQVTCVLVLLSEKAFARKWFSNRIAAVWYTVLISLHLILPVLVTLWLKGNPMFSTPALALIVIEALKLVSFVHVNYWCRDARDNNSPNASSLYPGNLNFFEFYYFMLAPTLCYELRFPRTPKRRKTFIVKRVVELACFSFVCVALSQQWVVPLVRNSLYTFSEMDLFRCVERVLKLAVPNHVIWLLFFYTIFHSFLNLLAEVLRFADREFYRDFWNAETISYFWQTWNIPVHRWCVRHVYKPMVKNGYNRQHSAIAVFLISAVFHEYLVSVPLHMFRLWAFWAMLAQVPLSMLTDKVIRGGRAGNVIVWLSIILGQPMAILMYVHDWYLLNHPEHMAELKQQMEAVAAT
uniref:O-acyltransferase n=1 Tax=Panagrellus redivivus TaxID=6233 RepID=A0A7E4W3L3_PANRE